jgi:cobalt-zinc-cadmium efflux system membrane fusion protein
MSSQLRFSFLRACALAAAGFLLLAACSHDGHDHGEDDHAHDEHGNHVAAPAELEAIGITAFSARHLLYLEFDPLIQGREARFLAHFSRLEDGAPVRSGRVALTTVDADGASSVAEAHALARDGLFIPLAVFPRAGELRATLRLETEGTSEEFALGVLQVHADEHAAEHAAPAAADPADAFSFLLEQQWKLGILLQEVRPRALTPRLPTAARVVLADGAEAQLRAPIPGVLEADAAAGWPRRGDRVTAGQLLGNVVAPLDPATQAQLQAQRVELELESLAAEQRIADAAARLRLAESDAARARRLAADQLRSAQQVERAEQELSLARQEAAAADAALAAVASARTAVVAGAGTVRLPLIAPITGLVEEAPRALGEFVEPQDLLLRLVDPSRLWLEARVSEFDLGRLEPALGGELILDAWPERSLALTPASGARLVSAGVRLDAVSRTALLLYEPPPNLADLLPGMRGVLHVAAAPPRESLMIPASALVWEAGVPTAFVLLGGETMQKRLLTLGARDGGEHEVLAGLAAGERVVMRGAYEVRLASLAPAEFGAGHAH